MMYRRINLSIRLAENLATKKNTKEAHVHYDVHVTLSELLFRGLELPLFPRQEDGIA
jgi:hypothetical protein